MHTPATCTIKRRLPLNNGLYFSRNQQNLLSRHSSHDKVLRPTTRQFRLIGYQLVESRALRRRTNYDGVLSFRAYDIPPIRQAFSTAICFGPRQKDVVVSFQDRIFIRRIRMTVTGLLRRVSIRFIVFVVSSG